MKKEKYKEGHFVGMWMGIGIAMFSGFGVVLSITTDNPGLIGIGPALGVAIGLSIGKGIEEKYKKEGKIIPLSEKEKNDKKIATKAGFVILLLGILAFLYLIFM